MVNWQDLKPFQPENLKTLTKKNFNKIRNSLLENNFIAGFHVWENENVYWILDGHHRKYVLQALKEEGVIVPEKLPCNVVDVKNKRQAIKFLLTYSSEYAHPDREGIAEFIHMNELDFDELDSFVDLRNVDMLDLKNDTIDCVSEDLSEEDTTPDLTLEEITKFGDIWILGNHRLMCGDSTIIDDVEKLMVGERADMAFTDPPYGYKYESNHYKKGNPHGMLENDDLILDFMPTLFLSLKDNSAIYICGSHQTIHKFRELVDKYFHYKNLIVWKKNNWSMGDLTAAYAGQHELIIFANKGRVNLRGERHRDIWEFNREPPTHHPTQKPVEMIEFAINNSSDKHNLILDLFGGSGSTLIAAQNTARKCYMMELSPSYCDVIIKRWQNYTGKNAYLEQDGIYFNELEKNTSYLKN